MTLTPRGRAVFERIYRRRRRIRASRADTQYGFEQAIREMEEYHRFTSGILEERRQPVPLRRVV